MYCPSCDKSYGAVHSRCPECHSWLKVSAPSNQRAKSAKAASSLSATGGVSTLDKEPAWPSSPAGAASSWGDDGSDSWSDALPAGSAGKGLSGRSPDPAGKDGWSDAGGWGDDPSASSESSWSSAQMPSASPASPVSSSSGGWLGGAEREAHDGWGGSPGLASSSPVAPSRGLGQESQDGWGAGSSLGSSPASLGGQDDWGGGSGSSFDSKAPAGGGGGWLGETDEPLSGSAHPLESSAPAAGWLSGGSKEVHSESSDGWLSGEDSHAPSMTEMVDHAIDVEEGDDFVDESWVDEEINSEFDELEVPEYTPPPPEVGSAFLKMLLVAALVVLVGGGVMFMGKEEKTPEQIQAEQRAKDLDFARSSVEAGKNYLKEGKPLLAVGPLGAAMETLKTSGAPEEEVWAAKVELARALTAAQEYEAGYEHWVGLVKGPEQYRAEAIAARDEVSRQLRAVANSELTAAADYFAMGESTSVVAAGEKALKIYEKHGGTASQKGRAIGVMGRGYLNGKEYGKARDHLQKARKLNPAGGYEADLRLIASRTAPVDYHAGASYNSGYSAPATSSRPIRVDASIDGGTNYAKASQTYSPSVRRSSSRAPAASEVAPAPAPKPRVQQPPPPPRRPSSSNKSGGRKGAKNVLPGYD